MRLSRHFALVALIGAMVTPLSAQVPVLLVPGWGDDGENLAPLAARLVDAGWPERFVVPLSFSDPVGSSETHAIEVASAVAALAESSGSAQVDIVAHSMGGLAVRHYLLRPEAAGRVRRVVYLATPHRGTVWAMLVWGDGAPEMVPGSEFLETLNEPGATSGEIEALTIRTPFDTHVIPGSSAMLPGASNIEVCCPSHQGLTDHQETFDRIQAFLALGPEDAVR